MEIEYSLNLTVHNKDFLLNRVLSALLEFTTGSYEIIVVLDGCTDTSENITKQFFVDHSDISHKILYTPDVFETKANNVAAKNSSGKYIIIIQDDMIVNEKGWNERLSKPIKAFNDIFAVTARTAHNWIFNPNSNHLNMKEDLDNCWCDILIHTDHAEKRNLDRNTFAIRDSVNRGPLLIKKDILEKMNYFDEIYSPQELDEHDLCYRTYKTLGLKSGCYWIDYISDLDWGGTRKYGITKPWVLKTNHKNSKILYERHKDLICGGKYNENRSLK